MAGEIDVDNGVLKYISNRSGHYTPEPEYFEQTILHLERCGINFDSVELDVLEP
jgi:cation transport regulator ChaC